MITTCMKKIETLLFVLIFSHVLTASSYGTVWITLADKAQNKIGTIGMSSGGIGKDTLSIIDNHSIVAIGSSYLPKSRKKLSPVLFKNLSTGSMILELSKLANSFEGRLARRVTLVRSNFETASFAGPGCHSQNNYCGEVVGSNYAITGGGLTSENVILNAERTILLNSNRGMKFECQLYEAMKTLHETGGEWKLFERLVIVVDDLNKRKDSSIRLFKRKKRHENDLFRDLLKYLRKKKNIYCQ